MTWAGPNAKVIKDGKCWMCERDNGAKRRGKVNKRMKDGERKERQQEGNVNRMAERKPDG